MIKTSVFVATSLDGFIAREDGRIDWLDAAQGMVPDGEDCGYQDFMATVDGLVMGRNTFEQVLSFPQWPYGELPVVVLSHQAIALPAAISKTVTVTAESPADLLARLAAAGRQHLYVDGGKTIQSFLATNLINEIIITVIPILIGTGKPLFGALPQDVQLAHVRSRCYDFGFVQHHYRVLNCSLNATNQSPI